MSRFKAGDLALIVACKLPELIGKTVELVKPLEPGEMDLYGERIWRNGSSAKSWIVTGDGLLCLTERGFVEPDQFTLIAEHKLMPLRGDFTPEQTKQQERPVNA